MCSSSHHRETSTPTQATTHPHLCTSIGSGYYTLKREEPVWVSDPCPGSTHDVAALDASGLLEGLDVSGWVADKGYIGRGMITPPRKPAGKQISDTAKKVSRSINRVRYIVEQVNAHIKTWKILKEDYRRPLNTFPQTITATLMLYTYTTTP